MPGLRNWQDLNRGPSREDLARSSYKNLLRASLKSFHTSISNTWHLLDLHARTSETSHLQDLHASKDLLERISLGSHKIFSQGPVQEHACLDDRSSLSPSQKDLYKTLVKIFISKGPLRAHSETRKIVREGPLRKEHRATSWQAQNDGMAAQAISTWAPRHSESNMTRTSWRESASDINVRAAPQRERSDARKTTARLRGRYQHARPSTTRAI